MSTFALFRFDKFLYPKNRILAHLIFWLIYLGYFTIAFASFRDNYTQSFIEVLVTLPVRMLATYLTLYWLISSFLDKEKYLAFTLIFIFIAIGIGYLDTPLKGFFAGWHHQVSKIVVALSSIIYYVTNLWIKLGQIALFVIQFVTESNL